MNETVMMKNIPFSEIFDIKSLVDYETGRVVSRTIAQKSGVGITLFAFDKHEEISTHASSGDAMVILLDGKATITIGEKKIKAEAGQTVVMPANIPHALFAEEAFKMLLIVVKL